MLQKPDHDRAWLTPPEKINTRSNFGSKFGTWLSFTLMTHKRKLISFLTILFIMVSLPILYNNVSEIYSTHKEKQAIEAKAFAEAAEKAKIAKWVKNFETVKVLTPFTNADIDKVTAFAKESYLDSMRELSRTYFSMEYIAKEDKYEVSFTDTQKEISKIISGMNGEYEKVNKFMNTFKNTIRTYENALTANNMTVLQVVAPQFEKDAEIYARWYNWMVSGVYHKSDIVTERAQRHSSSVESMEGLSKYLQSKNAQINNFEPFTHLIIK